MNKPAAKDPSMDEILSSIRQIIADDDAPEGGTIEETEAPAVPSEVEADAEMVALAASEEAPAASTEEEPLELSTEQMVAEPQALEELPEVDFNPVSAGAETVAPAEPEAPVEESPAEEVELVVADDIAFDVEETPEEMVEEDVQAGPAPVSAMPDPELSTDMANKLLAPTTDAAVRHTFAKLNSLSIGGADLTLESMVRDMLRPMLKEWLDEHLPATVERMVEKEIERVSRGE